MINAIDTFNATAKLITYKSIKESWSLGFYDSARVEKSGDARVVRFCTYKGPGAGSAKVLVQDFPAFVSAVSNLDISSLSVPELSAGEDLYLSFRTHAGKGAKTLRVPLREFDSFAKALVDINERIGSVPLP